MKMKLINTSTRVNGIIEIIASFALDRLFPFNSRGLREVMLTVTELQFCAFCISLAFPRQQFTSVIARCLGNIVRSAASTCQWVSIYDQLRIFSCIGYFRKLRGIDWKWEINTIVGKTRSDKLVYTSYFDLRQIKYFYISTLCHLKNIIYVEMLKMLIVRFLFVGNFFSSNQLYKLIVRKTVIYHFSVSTLCKNTFLKILPDLDRS